MLCPVNQFLSTYHHTINLIVLMKLNPKDNFFSLFFILFFLIIFPILIYPHLHSAFSSLLITIIMAMTKTFWMIYSPIVKSTSTNYEHCNSSFILFYFFGSSFYSHLFFGSSSNPSNHGKSMIDETEQYYSRNGLRSEDRETTNVFPFLFPFSFLFL